MSNYERDRDKPLRRRSVYNRRYDVLEQEWRPIAATNPVTGELEWAPDWPHLVTGWRPVEELMRDRGAM